MSTPPDLVGGARCRWALVAVAGAVALTGCAGPSAAGGTSGSAPGAVPTPVAAGPATPNPDPTAPNPTAPNPTAPNPNAPEIVAAGDIPDSQVFVAFSPPGGAFSVSVPQGWAQSVAGAATVFTDKFNSVRVEARPRSTAPDVASARAQEVPGLRGSTPGFAPGDVQAVRRSAGPAVLVTYTATSPANAVTGRSVTEAVERYAFWRGGQEVVLTLSGALGSDNVDPWRKVTDSFRWLR